MLSPMSLNRRHLFTASAGIAAAATLAACGSNSGGIDNGNSGGKDAKKASLQQWYHAYGEEGVKKAVEGYAAAYSPASVTAVWNVGDYNKKLSTTLLTDQVPDVFEAEQGGSLDMIKQGQIVDLTDIVKPVESQFNPAVMKRFKFEDKYYAVPQAIDMQLLYYRKSILDAKGIKPPTTFDELTKAANEVATGEMGGFFAGNNGIGPLTTMFIWASGLDQLDAERTKPAFLEPEFYAALNAYRDFFKTKGLLKAASKDWSDPDAFANGETAMQWGGLWSMPAISEKLKDDFGVVPFPAFGSGGRQVAPFGAFGACVAAKGKNVEAAKAFVKWLWIDQDDKQVDFANNYGTHIPAKPALVAKANKVASGPGADAAKFVTDHGQTNDIMWSGPLGTAYDAAVTNVVTKGADPASEFKSVAATAVSELKRLNG